MHREPTNLVVLWQTQSLSFGIVKIERHHHAIFVSRISPQQIRLIIGEILR